MADQTPNLGDSTTKQNRVPLRCFLSAGAIYSPHERHQQDTTQPPYDTKARRHRMEQAKPPRRGLGSPAIGSRAAPDKRSKRERVSVIYALVDPREPGHVRYVGMTTKSPQARFRDHLSDPAKNYRTNWIRSLLAANLNPPTAKARGIPASQKDAR